MISWAVEIDAAGREGVADEEVVGLVGVEVCAVLEVRIFDNGQRQLDRLRNDLAFKCRDRRLDGDGNLGRACAGGRALQALAGMSLAQNLRKPFSVSPPNGTKGCLASIMACTMPVSPPWAVMPSNGPLVAMASAVAFCATPSSHLPTTSVISHFLPEASRVS